MIRVFKAKYNIINRINFETNFVWFFEFVELEPRGTLGRRKLREHKEGVAQTLFSSH